MPEVAAAATASFCEQCQSPLAPGALVCSSCSAFTHAAELKRLAAEAQQAESAGDLTRALTLWREALLLIPPASTQYGAMQKRIQAISIKLDDGGQKAVPGGSKIPRPLAALGAVGVLIWKFKLVLMVVLTKGKLILLGLTKGSTFLSMFASFSLYWAIFGWRWALGFVLCIYIHEMGHVFALSRYGIKPSAPMFIPGFGAYVRFSQYPIDLRENARIGLAGPVWGAGAAAVCVGLSLALKSPLIAAIGGTAALINLFNLLPVAGLDGGQAFRAFSTSSRWTVVAAASAAAWLAYSVSHSTGIAAGAVAALAAFKAFNRDAPTDSDHQSLATFILTMLVLVGMAAQFGNATPGR